MYNLYLSDDDTPATGLSFSAAAGETTDAIVIHGWYNKGTNGGKISNIRFRLLIEDPDDPGIYKASGLPAVDEHWFETRINGGNNAAADPAFVTQTTDWIKLGTNATLPALDQPGNTAVYIELRLHPPLRDGAPTETVAFRLVAEYQENSFAISQGIAEQGQGILTGVGDRSVREFVEAPLVTATGTPDAAVHVSKRWYVFDGVSLRAPISDDLTLNQQSSGGGFLTSGQEYRALIVQTTGDGVSHQAATVIKGSAAAAGAGEPPALPANALAIAVVTVSYSAGASVIGDGNIQTLAVSGRGIAAIGTGLTITIAPFRAIIAGALIRATVSTTVVVTASSTNWVWLLSSSGFQVTTTSARPFVGALLFCKAVAGSSTVSSVTDTTGSPEKRTFLEPNAKMIQLRAPYLEEPLFRPRFKVKRFRLPIAAAASTTAATTGTGLVFSVGTKVIVQPPGTTSFDVGVVTDTQRYAAAVSSVVATLNAGLKDNIRSYTSTFAVVITPDTTPSDATGVIEIQITSLLVDTTSYLDEVALPFDWNLDRIAFRVGSAAGGGATGATTADLIRKSTAASIFSAGGNKPSIAAGSTADLTAYPNVTAGPADALSLDLAAVTAPGNDGSGDVEPRFVSASLVIYPMVLP